MRYALVRTSGNFLIWIARVPTEANISDFPSRLVEHTFLTVSHQCNKLAEEKLEKILAGIPMVLSNANNIGS